MINHDNRKLILHEDVPFMITANKYDFYLIMNILNDFFENFHGSLELDYVTIAKYTNRNPSIPAYRITSFLEQFVKQYSKNVNFLNDNIKSITLFKNMKINKKHHKFTLELNEEAYYLCSKTYTTIKNLSGQDSIDNGFFGSKEEQEGFLGMLKRYSDKQSKEIAKYTSTALDLEQQLRTNLKNRQVSELGETCLFQYCQNRNSAGQSASGPSQYSLVIIFFVFGWPQRISSISSRWL